MVVSRDVRFLGETRDTKELTDDDKSTPEVIPIEHKPGHEFQEFIIPTGTESEVDTSEAEELQVIPSRSCKIKGGPPDQGTRRYNLRSISRKRDCQEDDDLVGKGQPTKEHQDDQIDDEEVFHEANIIQFSGMTEISLNDALNGLHTDEWKNALTHEVRQILNRDTWMIVSRPVDKTVVGSRFVLTDKLSSDGKIDCRKARLVAKGFNQKPGIDYEQSFAPVARLESLRLLVAISVYLNMAIRQVDVVTAYLNSYLDKPVYMEIPSILTSILQAIARNDGEKKSTKDKAIRMLTYKAEIKFVYLNKHFMIFVKPEDSGTPTSTKFSKNSASHLLPQIHVYICREEEEGSC